MITLLILAALSAVPTKPSDPSYERDWFVSDMTDNNTGERAVWAFQTHSKDKIYVSLTMRCSSGKPTFFVEWDDVTFPDETVLSIGPSSSLDSAAAEQPYVFEKSEDLNERGLRATPEISAKIIAAIGQSKYAAITAHLSAGTRTVGMEVDGTQEAWSRVLRHCPVQIIPRPPL